MPINNKILYMLLLTFTACKVGSDYRKPEINIPDKFMEAAIDWKIINPKDNGNWWQKFTDPSLNELETKLGKNNYNIKAAESSYWQAVALVDKARLSYLPTISASSAILKQKQAQNNNNSGISSNHSLSLQASWEPDLWGSIASQIESAEASATSAKASLKSIELSNRASLAQYYFELRMLDKDQMILDKIVDLYQFILKYTENRYLTGVASDQDLLIAEQELQTSKVASINNRINREQYQHAIAVLIGESPSNFTISSSNEFAYPDTETPITIPSIMLENRPDIAIAEQQVAIASAGINIAKAAFFPSLTLSGSTSFQGDGIKKLLSLPITIWSFGPTLAANLTNLAAYKSINKAALENYNASLSNYRNTVIAAFQDVEDNMVALRVLGEQVMMQNIITKDAKRNLDIVFNQHESGIVDQSQLSIAEISYYNALKTLNDTEGLKLISSIALIKSLGGDWK